MSIVKSWHRMLRVAVPRERNRQSSVLRNRPLGFSHSSSHLVFGCWRRMRVMDAAFEQSESGGGSQEPSAERLRDEQAGSRMNDEGCPNQPLASPPTPTYTLDPRAA